MDKSRKNVAILSTCQGLLLTNNSILIATNGLAGFALAADKSLATLPVTGYVVGAALTTIPVSHVMRRWGRRAGFTAGTAFGIAGALVCSYAIYRHAFWLLCLGTLIAGVYNAAGQYYRFAAADAAGESLRARAISLVLAGGILGAVVGPQTSRYTIDLFAPLTYVGCYLSLIGFCIVAAALVQLIDVPPLSEAERRHSGRPLTAIMRQPAFIVAVMSAMIGYGVMNFLMTATPLAMVACHHSFGAAAFVIQWHIIGMFGPSFFTGSLIRRFGVLAVMVTGVVLNLCCIALALTGVDVAHFAVALMLLGIGWNFMYIGGTTLLTECYTPAERAKTQGVNDFLVFAMAAVTSVSSGALFTFGGWHAMNIGAVPVLLLAAIAMGWLALQRRQSQPAA
jgi:MFS family permease